MFASATMQLYSMLFSFVLFIIVSEFDQIYLNAYPNSPTVSPMKIFSNLSGQVLSIPRLLALSR